MAHVAEKLFVILANTYALYLKTQNYHWHVHGLQFKPLHELFEDQYRELAEAIDSLAERIRALGAQAPASFSALDALKTLDDGDADASAQQMVEDLYRDHKTLIAGLYDALLEAQEANDEGSAALLTDRISSHEKTHWMLGATREDTK